LLAIGPEYVVTLSTDFDVGSGIGTISLSSNTNRNGYLTAVSAADQELLVKVRVDHLAVGSDHLVWFYLRRQDASNFYHARIIFNTTGKITVGLYKTVAGVETVVQNSTTSVPHTTTGSPIWASDSCTSDPAMCSGTTRLGSLSAMCTLDTTDQSSGGSYSQIPVDMMCICMHMRVAPRLRDSTLMVEVVSLSPGT
jgi:hypothetical protein